MKPASTAGVALAGVPAQQARVLHDILPYVQSVQGKVFVVRCEGQWLAAADLRTGFARDVALLHLVGLRLVLVLAARGDAIAASWHTGRDLVGAIQQQGCRAVGLTAEDGGSSRLAGGLVQCLHARGFIPVVMPRTDPAGTADDADLLAVRLAQGLHAEKLLLQGDSPGVTDPQGQLVASLSARNATQWRDDATLPAATRARLSLALDVLAQGVRSVHFVDGRTAHALLLEVLSNAGDGTTVLPEQAPNFLDDSLRYLNRQ